MKSFTAACLLALVTASTTMACATTAETGDETAATEAAIQAGAPETGEPAVGMTVTASGYCTATLIAPDVVLTAGHCVSSPIQFFATTAGSVTPSVKHPVKAQAAFPGYRPLGCPNRTLDIGLVKLATPITDITPKTFGAAPAMGTTCRAIGFGRHNENGQVERGKKRSATETLVSESAPNLTVTAGTGIADHGDSGGPLLCDDVIVGTVSCHFDGSGDSHTQEVYARVTEGAEWIATQMQAWANP